MSAERGYGVGEESAVSSVQNEEGAAVVVGVARTPAGNTRTSQQQT